MTMYRFRLSRGFSLIELMVAMVIALVVMAGVINSFVASKDAFHYNDELAFIQENARFAGSRLAKDVREAGNFGCQADSPDNPSGRNNYRANNLVNVLGDTSTLTGKRDLYKGYGIQGYNSTTGYPGFVTAAHTPVAGSDVFIVRYADQDNAMVIQSHAGSVFTLSTAASANPNQVYKAGTIMVYADAQCRYQAIFESRGPTPPASTISHAASGTPGNFTTSLQGTLFKAPNYFIGDYANRAAEGCGATCSWVDAAATYLADSKVMPLVSQVYFVAPSSIEPTINSLWVSGLSNGGAIDTQELVIGVDDMRVYYGVDTDAVVDGIPNRYVTADVISSNDYATPASTHNYLVWNRVNSVRLQLLMRSHNKLAADVPQVFRWDDSAADVSINDGYLRQMVSFTIQMRNSFRG